MTLLHGKRRSFFQNSRCTIIAATHEFARESVLIAALSDADKRQWVCRLLRPALAGKMVLVHEKELSFESYHAANLLTKLPSFLRVAAAAGGLGLFAESALDAKGTVLAEPVNMLARRSARGVATGIPCWALYNFAQKAAAGGDKSSAEAFDALTDGGLVDRYSTDAREMFAHHARTSLPPETAKKLLHDEVLCQREVRRIAGCLARWQANGHDFTLRGESEKCSAVYNHGMRLQHSCEPNCEQHISGEGQFVVTTRHAIPAGELLTIDYTGGAVGALPLAKRRELLRRKGFECACSRCAREESRAAAASLPRSSSSSSPSGHQPLLHLSGGGEEEVAQALLKSCCKACGRPLASEWVFATVDHGASVESTRGVKVRAADPSQLATRVLVPCRACCGSDGDGVRCA